MAYGECLCVTEKEEVAGGKRKREKTLKIYNFLLVVMGDIPIQTSDG
jgi:hypothetical protein